MPSLSARYQTTIDDYEINAQLLDDIPVFGASIKIKQDGTFRVGSQNTNGTRLGTLYSGVEELDVIDKCGIDVMALQETNLAWTQDARSKLAALIKLQFGYGFATTSSAPSEKEGYQPGGTSMIAVNSVAGRVTTKYADKMGRYNYMAFTGKDNIGIVCINVYRVCQKKGAKTGPDTSFMVQLTSLREQGIECPDPRNQVLADVTDVITEWKQKGYHPLVMGDFNADLDDKDFAEFVDVNNLHDLIGESNEGTPPSTYSRGRKRLDWILGDNFLTGCLVKSGTLALHEGNVTDHTLQWADFDTQKVFGNRSYVPVNPCDRQFTLNNPKKKHEFQAKLEEIHKHQKIKERVIQLSDDFEALLNNDLDSQEMIELIDRYQRLDYEIKCSIISAANSVGRKDFGYQCSPDLVTAGMTYRLWKMILSCKRRKKQYSEQIYTLADDLSCKYSAFELLNYKEIRTKLREVRAQKRLIEKADSDKRAQWLEKLAIEATIDEPLKDWKQILEQMISAAKQKGMQRKLTGIFKPDRSSLRDIEVPADNWYFDSKSNELFEFDKGLFRAHPNKDTQNVFHKASTLKVLPPNAKVVTVEITVDSIINLQPESTVLPTWTRVENTADMESWLRQRNKKHHQQVHEDGSFPTTTEFFDIVGEHGTTSQVDALLDGTFDVDAVDFPDYVKDWLRWMKRTPAEKELKEIQPRITPERFAEAFKNTDEMTSSSPSGLHYTLWKAIAEKSEFCEYFSVMMSLPFQYGFSNKRWETAIDVMLEKKPGVRKIHLMRIIGLVEADFNTALKIYFAQGLMRNAEASGLTPDQWGGRPNRSAPDCATRKLLTWEYKRYMKQTMGSFFGDLASCFDRMKTCLSSITSMKKGMPRSVCLSRSTTVKNMKRQIRTAAGTTEATYQFDPETDEYELDGEIQGKGDVMCHWTNVSDSIIQTHRKHTAGVTLHHVATGDTSSRSADAYVDDTDVYAEPVPFQPTDEEWFAEQESPTFAVIDPQPLETMHILQACAQMWVYLVLTIGHLMAFHKCSWQLLAYKPVDGRMIPMTSDDRQGNLHLHDLNGIHSKITHKKNDNPNVGLGFSIAPLGDQEPEYQKRLAQAKFCASCISTATFTTAEAWLALVTRVLPKVTYPFMLTRFNKKQIYRLMVTLDNAILPKLGISRKMKRVAVYAPLELGGIGYPFIGTIQDQKGIGHLVKHLQWNKEIGNDMRILLSVAQLHSGFTTPIMDDTSMPINYLEQGHIAHLRQRLHELKGSVWIENVWVPALQRLKDVSIMERFSQVPGATEYKLRMANECRLFLRVITIAELANVDGRFISPDRLDGSWQAQSTLRWPTQCKPSKKMWENFRWFLRKSFCQLPRIVQRSHQMPLDVPLGQWIKAPRHVHFQFYRSQEWVYRKDNTAPGAHQYQCFRQLNPDSNAFIEEHSINELPPHVTPVEVIVRNSLFGGMKVFPIQEYSLSIPELPPTPPPPDYPSHNLVQLYASDEIIGVSDGSMDPMTGHAGYEWVLALDKKAAWVKHAETVRANPKYMTSFRVEAAGVHNMLKYILDNGLTDKKTTIWCDNEAVIKVLTQSYQSLTDLTNSESDLIKSSKDIIEQMTDVTFKHLLGHQDDDTPYEDLPFEVQLNVDCDTGAKHIMQNGNFNGPRPEPLSGAGAMLYFGTDMVTTEMNEQIAYAVHAKDQFEYLHGLYEWTDAQTQTINWKAIGWAKERLRRHKSIRISKMMHQWLNVGKQKGRMGKPDQCPCCGKTVEDQTHLYHCDHEEMQTAKEIALDEMATRLSDANVPKMVIICFIDEFRKAIHSTRAHGSINCSEAEGAATAQVTLGTFAILRGHHHQRWVEAISKTHTRRTTPPGEKKRRDKSPFDMSVMLIEEAWTLFETLWFTRNAILHGSNSYVGQLEENTWTSRLLEYKYKQNKLLHYGDRYLIDYPRSTILSWDRVRKKSLLKKLDRLHKQYKREYNHANTIHRKITTFEGYTRGTQESSDAEPAT